MVPRDIRHRLHGWCGVSGRRGGVRLVAETAIRHGKAAIHSSRAAPTTPAALAASSTSGPAEGAAQQSQELLAHAAVHVAVDVGVQAALQEKEDES